MCWEEVDGKLEKNYTFKSQTELVNFMLQIAVYADQLNHHPDFRIHKAFQLEIKIFSHDVNKITALDHQLAEFINSLELLE